MSSVLFILPEAMEESLWALPCIGQYLMNRLVTDRAVKRVVTICPLVEIHYLLAACWKGMEIYRELTPEVRDEMDLVFEFDAMAAYHLTEKVEKHIVEAYGTMLGTVSMNLLPPMAPTAREERGTILVVDAYRDDTIYTGNYQWEKADDFVAMGRAFGLEVDKLNMELPFREMVKEISRFSVVVGLQGSATLIAASLGKTVMELSKEHVGHKNWMSKWENKSYTMVHGELRDMSPIFIWERTRTHVERISGRETKQWGRLGPVRSVAGR